MFELLRACVRMHAVVVRGAEEALRVAEVPLTVSQYFVLAAIAETRGRLCIQADVATAMGVSPASVSRHIDNLLHTKYILCTLGQDDARTYTLALTAKGARMQKRAQRVLQGYAKKHWAGCSERDVQAFVRVASSGS